MRQLLRAPHWSERGGMLTGCIVHAWRRHRRTSCAPVSTHRDGRNILPAPILRSVRKYRPGCCSVSRSARSSRSMQDPCAVSSPPTKLYRVRLTQRLRRALRAILVWCLELALLLACGLAYVLVQDRANHLADAQRKSLALDGRRPSAAVELDNLSQALRGEGLGAQVLLDYAPALIEAALRGDAAAASGAAWHCVAGCVGRAPLLPAPPAPARRLPLGCARIRAAIQWNPVGAA